MSTREIVDGVEWAEGQDEPHSEEVEQDACGRPALNACYGADPTTGNRCIGGYHKGNHKDASGAEWLDEE